MAGKLNISLTEKGWSDKIKDYMRSSGLRGVSLSLFERWDESNSRICESSGIHSVRYNPDRNILGLYEYRKGSYSLCGRRIKSPTIKDYSDAYQEMVIAVENEMNLPAAVRRKVFCRIQQTNDNEN